VIRCVIILILVLYILYHCVLNIYNIICFLNANKLSKKSFKVYSQFLKLFLRPRLLIIRVIFLELDEKKVLEILNI